jgi:hypothetical protein
MPIHITIVAAAARGYSRLRADLSQLGRRVETEGEQLATDEPQPQLHQLPRRQPRLAVHIKVIVTQPCIFCMENH